MAPPTDSDDSDGGGIIGGGGGGDGGDSLPTGGSSDWIARLQGLSNVNTSDLGSSFTKLLLLPIAAFFISAADLVEAGFNVFVAPLFSLGDNISEVIDALVGGAGDILQSGAQASVNDISIFGIVGFPVSFGVIAIVLFAFGWVLSQESTSNIIPFTSTDLPLIGAEEDD